MRYSRFVLLVKVSHLKTLVVWLDEMALYGRRRELAINHGPLSSSFENFSRFLQKKKKAAVEETTRESG
jgi:hypothetical protein